MERKKRRGYRDSEGVGERAVASLSPPRKRAQSMPDEAGVLRITLGDEARASSDVGATVLLENADIAVEEGDTVTMAWTLERNLPKEAFLPTLLRAYDNIHARYTRMKARKMDIEAQFEEQRSSHARFQQVADRYIQDMCSENLELRKTLDAAEKKIKWLESLYLKRQKEGFRRGAEEADCEAAASPVRPLTPTSDQVGAEGAPLVQLPSEHAREEAEGEEDVALPSEHAREEEGEEDVALPSEHAREAEGEEDVALPSEHAREGEGEEDVALPSEHAREAGEEDVAGCRVGDTAPQEIVENRGDEEILETEIGRDNDIAATHENAPNEGNVEGQHHGEDGASAAVPALESSLENGRCLEDAAPAELDMAVVVCPEPIDSRSYLNEAEFQDLHRKYVDLQNLHLKEVEVLDQQRREAELQFHRREEAELQNLHRKEVELQHLHRQEVAGLLLEVEMLQKVLGHFIGMTVASDEVSRARKGKPTLIFSHSRTGFRFTLELPEEQDEVAKDLELSYRNLSLGTLYRVAPWWMKEEFFCSVTQLGNFMRRFQETVTGRKLYS